jgi:hypothetical protein
LNEYYFRKKISKKIKNLKKCLTKLKYCLYSFSNLLNKNAIKMNINSEKEARMAKALSKRSVRPRAVARANNIRRLTSQMRLPGQIGN